MLTSQGRVLLPCTTNTHVPLRQMLEDTKTNWLWECWASERRKDLASSKRDLQVSDWKQRHFKQCCRKSIARVWNKIKAFEKSHNSHLPIEEQWKSSNSARWISKSKGTYQFCVACHPRAHPRGYSAKAKTPWVWSTWVQAHSQYGYANPALLEGECNVLWHQQRVKSF